MQTGTHKILGTDHYFLGRGYENFPLQTFFVYVPLETFFFEIPPKFSYSVVFANSSYSEVFEIPPKFSYSLVFANDLLNKLFANCLTRPCNIFHSPPPKNNGSSPPPSKKCREISRSSI